jgi:hypothetical protein
MKKRWIKKLYLSNFRRCSQRIPSKIRKVQWKIEINNRPKNTLQKINQIFTTKRKMEKGEGCHYWCNGWSTFLIHVNMFSSIFFFLHQRQNKTLHTIRSFPQRMMPSKDSAWQGTSIYTKEKNIACSLHISEHLSLHIEDVFHQLNKILS